MRFLRFLILLLAVLLQELVLGWPMVLPLLLGLSALIELPELFYLGFGIGLVRDLVRGGIIGISSMIYLGAIVVLWVLVRRLPFGLVAVIVAGLSVLEMWWWGRIGPADFVVALVVYVVGLWLWRLTEPREKEVRLR